MEVARCIYQTYGYTYPDEDVYYPEKLAALNASGQLLSAVALAASGEIAGHCALRFGKLRTGPAEITQGAVKPQFRSMGVMTRLTDYLVKKAASYGLAGIRARPVTHHTHSQRIGHKFGLKDCGICLALIPRTTTFRQMASGSGCRVSTLVQFGHLTAPDRLEVFPPDHHRDMIARLYRHLEVPVRLRLPLQQPALDDHSVFDVQVIDMLSHARIRVTRCGNGIERQVRETLRQLCLERVEVIHLVLYLSDPAAALQVKRFEDLGFFFSGISPLDVDHGYGLVLQYLNNVPLDYDEIQVASPVGRTLLAYVKARDPNRG